MLQFWFKYENNINGHFMWIRFWGYLERKALHIYWREKRFEQTLKRKLERTRKFYTQVTHSVSIAVLELIKGKESIMLWLLYDRSKSLFKKWHSAIHFLISNIHAKYFGYKRSPGSSLCASQHICIVPVLSRPYYTEVIEPQNPKNIPNCITVLIFKPLQHQNSQFSWCLCSFVLYPLAHIKEISMSGNHKFKKPGNNTAQTRKAGNHSHIAPYLSVTHKNISRWLVKYKRGHYAPKASPKVSLLCSSGGACEVKGPREQCRR
jgi:hypothetical protein